MTLLSGIAFSVRTARRRRRPPPPPPPPPSPTRPAGVPPTSVRVSTPSSPLVAGQTARTSSRILQSASAAHRLPPVPPKHTPAAATTITTTTSNPRAEYATDGASHPWGTATGQLPPTTAEAEEVEEEAPSRTRCAARRRAARRSTRRVCSSGCTRCRERGLRSIESLELALIAARL